MLLRLAYLAATNAFASLRLLPMSERDKDIEIPALRHQLMNDLVVADVITASEPSWMAARAEKPLRVRTA
ncbi:hypothetical protein [Streptomyces longhuiensis]|uniref:hypothetical protein n=1 Tax=Streptomyces longhuiensis TaxID=2880933 RepID=UPI001D0B9AE3|nr:hypothetical protein [Streptomyces longhuiensis]UDM03395.1 hypothetical protein LGI35_36685 [Streptomyces longhuiensis]